MYILKIVPGSLTGQAVEITDDQGRFVGRIGNGVTPGSVKEATLQGEEVLIRTFDGKSEIYDVRGKHLRSARL